MIYGERIRFRAAERGDLPTFVRWINDPEVQAGIGIYRPYSQAEEDAWFERMLSLPADEHLMAIELREGAVATAQDTWKLIGSIGFFRIDWRNRASEFGINIGEKNHWNQGYGTEAVRLLVKFGFETLNLHRIFLRVLDSNPRAIRAYEKAGFTHEVRMRQAEFRSGKYIDMLVMSILRPEYSVKTNVQR
jgi:RimJ/RimL family protein N-acetyltransferase